MHVAHLCWLQFLRGLPIMADPKILWLEPSKARKASYAAQVARRRYAVQVVHDQRAACRFAAAQHPLVCVVDVAPAAAVQRVCSALRKAAPKMRIIVVQARAGMEVAPGCAEVLLCAPFTIRKLLNSIRQQLPANGGEWIAHGALRLHPAARRLQLRGHEHLLSPKLLRLLEFMLAREGKPVSTTLIVRRVWETEYTSDLNTLHNHINTLRKILEVDPAHPHILRTVRGKGYCLSLNGKAE